MQQPKPLKNHSQKVRKKTQKTQKMPHIPIRYSRQLAKI